VRRNLLRGTIVLAIAGVGAGVAAQERAVERGRAIAETWCVACHAIGETSQASALADAPSFRTLGQEPGFGPERLRRALLLPHPAMPEFPVTNADIDALAAYIGSLSGNGAAPAEERTELTPDRQIILIGAEDAADQMAEHGRAIVMRDCSPCHLVEGVGESPVADAPAFATLSERYPVAHLAEALAEGIMVGHEGVEMPQYVYEPQDIGAIIAHLERIQVSGER